MHCFIYVRTNEGEVSRLQTIWHFLDCQSNHNYKHAKQLGSNYLVSLSEPPLLLSFSLLTDPNLSKSRGGEESGWSLPALLPSFPTSSRRIQRRELDLSEDTLVDISVSGKVSGLHCVVVSWPDPLRSHSIRHQDPFFGIDLGALTSGAHPVGFFRWISPSSPPPHRINEITRDTTSYFDGFVQRSWPLLLLWSLILVPISFMCASGVPYHPCRGAHRVVILVFIIVNAKWFVAYACHRHGDEEIS